MRALERPYVAGSGNAIYGIAQGLWGKPSDDSNSSGGLSASP